jgi:YHS domain-containing protein
MPAESVPPDGVSDPVCGTRVEPARALAAEHRGRRSHFCSDICHELFRAAPERFQQAAAGAPSAGGRRWSA